MPLDIVCNTDQMVPIIVNPTTASGKPAKLDGVPVLSITSGNATTRAATADEMTATPGLVGYLISADIDGASAWAVDGDADLGAGVTDIKETGAFTYSAAPAVSVGASAGTPVPKG